MENLFVNDTKKPHITFCSEPWFTQTREGRRTVELSKADGGMGGLAVGDVLLYRNPANLLFSKQFLARVTGVKRYEGPGALRKSLEENLARNMPWVETLEEGEAHYLECHTNEEIDAVGMVAIQIAVMPNAQ